MIKFKSSALCLIFLLFIASSTYSQSKPVILYNSQPIQVELTEKGNIQSFLGVVPGYMEGYDTSIETTKTVNPEIAKEPVVPPPATKNAGYTVVTTERIELKYRPNFAILDKVTINALNDVAARMKADPNVKILLTAHTSDMSKDKLSSNRIDSAIAYLGIKGILSYRIQTDTQKSESLRDILVINYLN